MIMSLTWISARIDVLIARAAVRRNRLIGLAITRVIIGATTILYCLADYSRREFFWGPRGYLSPAIASADIPRWGFSIFLFNNSQWWFELVFNLCIVVAAAFMVFGGRALTVAQAVMLWSLHYRNQDIIDGGDNLAQILIIFMIFTVTNAYFVPGARKRRERLSAGDGQPRSAVLIHNVGAYLVVFQTCMLYLAAGYWKMFGTLWQNGVAMYYISRVQQFDMFSAFSQAVNNPYLGTVICWATIVIEVGFAFSVLSVRPWLRKANILLIEGMHMGIIIFMGLVTFGLIMIGADSVCLRDDDYRTMRRYAAGTWGLFRQWRTALPGRRPVPELETGRV
jgi:hypothetical protein